LVRRVFCIALLAVSSVHISSAQASSARYCDAPAPGTAAQQDRVFRFGAVIKTELEKSGRSLALISRAGLDLARFGQRYSHAGFSLKANPQTPWAVRQLYYECDAKQSRLFDQGLAAFLLGADDRSLGFVSVVLLPEAATAELELAVLDKPRALQMLSPHYSANAFAFSTQFQNCNQWVAEFLALVWGAAQDPGASRQHAQTWLQEQGYAPTVFDVGWRLLMWLSGLSPWLHSEDHPPQDLDAKRFRVSMPASLEAFVQRQLPGARRIEFCHTQTHIVVHEGWQAIADGCQPGEGDTVLALD
jgi:hypothetical protein